ncbi:hypothetical protein HOC01_06630 [archaeon]|nr:hypothetical protein [archaeon]MBT6697483.1 hypothetical protein [archaeon]
MVLGRRKGFTLITKQASAYYNYKFENYVAGVYNAIRVFYQKTAPEIEILKIALEIIQEEKFQLVTPEEMDKLLRTDLASAIKGLRAYKLIINIIDNRRVSLNSNAREFFKRQSGISPSDFDFDKDAFDAMIYASYGSILKRIQLMYIQLHIMKNVLERQIKILKSLRGTSHGFIEGLAQEETALKLFYKERAALQEINRIYNLGSEEVENMTSHVRTYSNKLKIVLEAYSRKISRDSKSELDKSKTKVEWALTMLVLGSRLLVTTLETRDYLKNKSQKSVQQKRRETFSFLIQKSKELGVAVDKQDLRNIELLSKVVKNTITAIFAAA